MHVNAFKYDRNSVVPQNVGLKDTLNPIDEGALAIGMDNEKKSQKTIEHKDLNL